MTSQPGQSGQTGELAARLQILAAAVLFSTGAAAIKATALSSWQVACSRSGLAAAALGLVLWRRGQGGRLRGLGWVPLAYALALTGYVVANKLTIAANTIFLYSTAPIWVVALSPWLLREKPRSSDLAMLVLLVGGMTLVFAASTGAVETAPSPRLGNGVAAVSAVFWALTLVGLRRLGRGEKRGAGSRALAAVVGGNGLAFVLALPLALPVASVTAVDAFSIGYLGLIQIGLAYLLLLSGLRRVRAVEVSLLLLLEPLLNPVWAWLLHGEIPEPAALLGGAVIVCALGAHLWSSAARAR